MPLSWEPATVYTTSAAPSVPLRATAPLGMQPEMPPQPPARAEDDEAFQLPALSSMFGRSGMAAPVLSADVHPSPQRPMQAGPARHSPSLGATGVMAGQQSTLSSAHPYHMPRDGRTSPVPLRLQNLRPQPLALPNYPQWSLDQQGRPQSPLSPSSPMSPSPLSPATSLPFSGHGALTFDSSYSATPPSDVSSMHYSHEEHRSYPETTSAGASWPFSAPAGSYFPQVAPRYIPEMPRMLYSHQSAPASSMPTLAYAGHHSVPMPALSSAPLLGRPAALIGGEPTKEVRRKRSYAKKKIPPPAGCAACGATTTPEWRRGPSGNRTLCNACGLQAQKRFPDPATSQEEIEEQLRIIGEARRTRSNRMTDAGIAMIPGITLSTSDSEESAESGHYRSYGPGRSSPDARSPRPASVSSPPLVFPKLESSPPQAGPADADAMRHAEQEAAASLSALSLPPTSYNSDMSGHNAEAAGHDQGMVFEVPSMP